jgi:3',5'-cyclic AMP phosphodiesterase CpdA
MDLGSGSAHSYIVDDLAFFAFTNPSASNYRLTAASPGRGAGTRFGAAAGLLPSTDIDGNTRINGIVDMGAYESTLPQDPGTSGTYFSRNLISPRMTWPVLVTQGSAFEARIAMLGTVSPGSVSATLVNPFGASYPLTVQSVSWSDLTPSSELAVQLYEPGIERVQKVSLQVPAGTPPDFYDIQISVAGSQFQSQNAVRVFSSYPTQWAFVHITDLHVGFDEEEYSSAERFGFFVPEAGFLNPAFVIATGDICENQNISNTYADSLLQRISTMRVPVFLLPGNHDHYNHAQENSLFGYYRYFQSINRYENAELAFAGARFYCLNSGPDAELVELYRCMGPSTASLAWTVSRLTTQPAPGPRFMAFHGPNYDYFSWNLQNVAQVRDMMNSYDFALGLAGHTHRFETFLNSGDNYLGRNDFSHEDDWGRDVPFPGFPLHVQTSSLGKEEHISWPGLVEAAPPSPEMQALLEESRSDGRGIFGDSIGWRYVRVNGTDVMFFTADTDGDGYRNTENPWILGGFTFTVQNLSGGVIQSTVHNDHYETWHDVRHYIPAVPGQSYVVTGGTFVRQYPDGIVEVAVSSVSSMGNSVVVLTPSTQGVGDEGSGWAVLGASPNPFSGSVTLSVSVPAGAGAVSVRIYDATGRTVRILHDGELPAGASGFEWDGSGQDGEILAPGVYFLRVESCAFSAVQRVVRL